MTQNKESGCLLYQKISVKGDQHGPFFQLTNQITKFLLKTALEKNFLFLGLYGEKKVKI